MAMLTSTALVRDACACSIRKPRTLVYLAQHSRDDSGAVLIVQQEKTLGSAVSDYIDWIADGRGPHQRVMTQPRLRTDIGGLAR